MVSHNSCLSGCEERPDAIRDASRMSCDIHDGSLISVREQSLPSEFRQVSDRSRIEKIWSRCYFGTKTLAFIVEFLR